MLIRSQNKLSLTPIDTTYIRVEEYYKRDGKYYDISAKELFNDGISVFIIKDKSGYLGEYSTKAKAIKVLDMIQDAYSYVEFIKISEQCMKFTDFIFQMPSDEEVEE